MNHTHTITVTIGRNVGREPLGAMAWHAYCQRTLESVTGHSCAVLFIGTGAGIWQGTREQAFTIVASVGLHSRLEGLRTDLASLASDYRQDAIALTIGQTELIG